MADRDDYTTQLNTTASPWLPREPYATGTIFLSFNAFRILSIEATRDGISGGGVNPDMTYWGNPFTQWLLSNAQIGSTLLDGTVEWKVVAINPTELAPPAPPTPAGFRGGDPNDNFYQNPSIGGTPVGFLNIIDATFFEPLIHEHWDFFEQYWREKLHMTTPLYAVEILFNAEIYLSGQGALPPNMTGVIPQFENFTLGSEVKRIKKEIGIIADHLGILPVTLKNARAQLPNRVFITSPHFPKPGQSGRRERGGSFSNL